MDLSAPATKGDLVELANEFRGELYGVRDHLRDDLRGEMYSIRDGLRDELRGEMHGIRDELRGEMRALEQRLHFAIADSANRVIGVFSAELGRQLATWTNTILDNVSDRIRGADDRYRDLPGRVSQLEARVERLEGERDD